MKSFEVQMGQLASSMNAQQKGHLPSNTEKNPKEQYKAITLRSGKKNKGPQVQEESAKEEVVEKEKSKEVDKPNSITFPNNPPILAPPLTFSQRFKRRRWMHNSLSSWIFFKKIHINIPFLDALEQIPNYVKFMKEVMSKKKRLEDYEIVKLTEKCSAILTRKLPQKLKDPGSFTIQCFIGDCPFDKALCDLVASINLMPLSIFWKLGLGEVNPITITL